METENKLRLADVFVAINDPRQPGKVEHDLVELLVVAVNAVLAGADTFVEIEPRNRSWPLSFSTKPLFSEAFWLWLVFTFWVGTLSLRLHVFPSA